KAVMVNIAYRDKDAAREERVVGHDLSDHDACVSIEHAYVRTGCRSRRGDDVGRAIAIDITQGNAYATLKARIIRIKLANLLAGEGIVDHNLRRMPEPRAGGEVVAARCQPAADTKGITDIGDAGPRRGQQLLNIEGPQQQEL